jgi:hypothetical protein
MGKSKRMEATIEKRSRTFAAVAATLAIAGITPAMAGANPILSGYGGPGQGSQVILGAGLVNGSRGGGGRGSGSSPSGSGESVSSIAAALAAPQRSALPRRPARGASGRPVAHGRPTGRVARPAGVRLKPHATGADIVKSHPAQPLLGISQSALIGILLAVGGLILVGLLTWRSARPDAGTQRPQVAAPVHRNRRVGN